MLETGPIFGGLMKLKLVDLHASGNQAGPQEGDFLMTASRLSALADLRRLATGLLNFVVLGGAKGTGKTSLIEHWQRENDTSLALVRATASNNGPSALMKQLATAFSIDPEIAASGDFLSQWRSALSASGRRGVNTVLVIDNAERLDTKTLELVQLFASLRQDGRNLLRILVSGRPELLSHFDDATLKAIAGHSAVARLENFTLTETADFMKVLGAPAFDEGEIYRASHGNPGAIAERFRFALNHGDEAQPAARPQEPPKPKSVPPARAPRKSVAMPHLDPSNPRDFFRWGLGIEPDAPVEGEEPPIPVPVPVAEVQPATKPLDPMAAATHQARRGAAQELPSEVPPESRLRAERRPVAIPAAPTTIAPTRTRPAEPAPRGRIGRFLPETLTDWLMAASLALALGLVVYALLPGGPASPPQLPTVPPAEVAAVEPVTPPPAAESTATVEAVVEAPVAPRAAAPQPEPAAELPAMPPEFVLSAVSQPVTEPDAGAEPAPALTGDMIGPVAAVLPTPLTAPQQAETAFSIPVHGNPDPATEIAVLADIAAAQGAELVAVSADIAGFAPDMALPALIVQAVPETPPASPFNAPPPTPPASEPEPEPETTAADIAAPAALQLEIVPALRDLAVVEQAIAAAPGLGTLTEDQRISLTARLVDGVCVDAALQEITGKVNRHSLAFLLDRMELCPVQ